MNTSRPRRLIGVLGTHTGVGKTWTTVELLKRIRAQGIRAAARKPVQSFDPGDAATDAHSLAAASDESPEEVCKPQYWYALPMAPPMAAEALERPRISMDDLIAHLHWPTAVDVGFIETVGGPRSPLTHDGDSVELLNRCTVDELLLVADAGLGVVNAVRLALSCCGQLPTKIFLNRFERGHDLHRRNVRWLNEVYGIPTLVDLDEWIDQLSGVRTC